MSGILYKEYAESPQRTVVFLTVLPPEDWRWIASRYLGEDNSRIALDIDISRDTSSELTCHELTLTLPMDSRSREQILTTIFGDDFLDAHLPITDKKKMGDTGGVFVRMGSVANPTGPPSSDEEYAFYSALVKRGVEQNRRYWECFKEFDKAGIIDAVGTGNVADMEYVREQAKKHGVEGGSWLLHPQDKTNDNKMVRAGDKVKMCRRAFDTVLTSFLEGSLLDSEVTRVIYTPIKGVVKVFNPKSEYFEQIGRTPRPSIKEIYTADVEVNHIYLLLSNLGLSYMRCRYKPEIFTVWKLNAQNTQGFLTLYCDTELSHSTKMEIARSCMTPTPSSSTPSPPPAT